MGLFDGLLGGGAGSADDPYADILTPAQRNQMQVQGLLAMAGAFAQAGMPSRLPVPFGSALGSAAAALGTGQEAGMKTAIENALAAQKVRDLRNMAEYRKKVLGDIDPTSPLGRAIDAINNPGGTTPTPGPTPAVPGAGGSGTSSGAASPAAPAAGGPLMMPASMLYPEPTGGGLLGPGDDTGLAGPTGKGVGLLSPGPAAASQAALSQDAAAAEVARLDAAYAASNPNASPAAKASVHAENIIRVNPPERGGSSTAPAEPDPGAGGDGWGPTFAQQAAARIRGAPTPEMTDAIVKAAAANNLPPQIMHGLLGVESNFNPNAVSPTGAKGVAQFISSTARSMKLDDPFDPQKAIPKSAEYLAQLRDQYGGDLNKALMAYNAGGDQSKWNPGYAAAVNRRAGEFVPPDSSGGGADTGWGPTFAQGGPDRVIPSGAGGNPPAATLAQYAPGGGGAAGGAVPGMPQLAPPTQLAPPGVPGLPGAPAQGPGLPQTPANQQAGLNALIVELARRNAAAEVLGLGNPYGSLLTVLQGSPQYKAQVESATAAARIAQEEPSKMRIDAANARLNLIQQMAKDGLTLDKDNNPVEIPGMRDMLGRTAGEQERAKQEATSKFQLTDARVIGPDGQPTTTKMPIYEYIYRQQQSARNAAMGAKPQPGDIVSSPISGAPPEGFEYRMDPNGKLTAEPIPGTPAEQVVKDRVRKQAVSDQANLVARDIMVQNATRVEDLVMNSTLPVTGTAGPFLSRIGGTAANDVRVMVETMKARASLDQLNQMRNSNPTGAGLGNVSNAEGDRLAAAIANLDQSQTKEQFLFNLRRLKQEYVDIVHGPGTYSKLSDEPVLKVPAVGGIDKPTYDRLPSGSPYTAPDGSRRIKP